MVAAQRRFWQIHLSTLVVINLLVAAWMYTCFCNVKSEYIGNGHIESLYGWPVPFLLQAVQATTEDKALFCCDRDGPFPLEVFEAHPEKFNITPQRLDYSVLLLLQDLGIVGFAILVVAVPMEVFIRRRARKV